MRVWIARFSFSLIVIACVLVWEAYVESKRGPAASPWQVALYLAGALCALVLGVVGIRERHRPRD